MKCVLHTMTEWVIAPRTTMWTMSHVESATKGWTSATTAAATSQKIPGRSRIAQVRARTDVRAWCRRQAEVVVATDVRRALRTIPQETAMTDRAALREVTAPTLVLAQERDPAHPVPVAEQIAGLIPGCRLEVLPPGGIMWQHRDRVRSLVGEFLG